MRSALSLCKCASYLSAGFGPGAYLLPYPVLKKQTKKKNQALEKKRKKRIYV